MYLTSGAKVRTRRSRSARSFVRRYSRQSASESSEDILRAARLGAVASVMLVLLQSRGTGRGVVSATRWAPLNALMPLRLIDPPDPPRPSATHDVPAASLAPSAAARLAAGDWSGYRAHIAEALKVADDHRRYQACRAIVEA